MFSVWDVYFLATMALNPDKFAKIADSLRQYRRAELPDFQADVGGNPVDLLYVDPLESDAVLKTVLRFLIISGRFPQARFSKLIADS
jgi:hypothetical protein